jgi:hypothetical protein
MYRVNLPAEFPVDLPTKGYDWDDQGFLHIFKHLPGITLPVLQQHLEDLLQAAIQISQLRLPHIRINTLAMSSQSPKSIQ